MSNHPRAYSITELNHLRDRAREDAELLRQEALQDFWRGADQMIDSVALSVRRSARRFASRFNRHASRAVVGPCKSTG